MLKFNSGQPGPANKNSAKDATSARFPRLGGRPIGVRFEISQPLLDDVQQAVDLDGNRKCQLTVRDQHKSPAVDGSRTIGRG